jgi:Putative peptidoglycan binding domain
LQAAFLFETDGGVIMKVGFRLLCVLAASVTFGSYAAPSSAAPLCDGPPPAIWSFLPELPKGCQKERIQASGELSFNVFRKAASIAEASWQREVITKYGERFQDLRFAACKNVLCVKGAVSGTERCTISAFPCASDMGEPARAQVEHLASLDDQNLSGEDRRRAERAQERREAAREEKREEQREERRDQIREVVREERRDEREERREQSFVDRDLNPQEVRELQHLLNRAGYAVRPDGVFGDESRDALSAWERRIGMRDDGYPTFEALERLRRDIR